MGVSELPVLPASHCILNWVTAESGARWSGGQDELAYKRNSVSSAPRGLPVFGSSGKLGMQDFGTESSAHLRQVCLILLIIIIIIFYWPASGSCVHFISLWGGCPPPLLSLTLSLSLSLCLEGKTVKPCTFPFMKKSHREQRPRQEDMAPQMSHSPASTFWRSTLLGRGLPGALGLLFPAFLPKCCFSRNKPT